MGKFGLSVDNVLALDVVTADGRFQTASAEENPDLYWALRGGGGNFGVVTSFEFRLHSVGPTVLAGPILWDASDAQAVLRFYRDFVRDAPDELGTVVRFGAAPPTSAPPRRDRTARRSERTARRHMHCRRPRRSGRRCCGRPRAWPPPAAPP